MSKPRSRSRKPASSGVSPLGIFKLAGRPVRTLAPLSLVVFVIILPLSYIIGGFPGFPYTMLIHGWGMLLFFYGFALGAVWLVLWSYNTPSSPTALESWHHWLPSDSLGWWSLAYLIFGTAMWYLI